MTDSYTIKSFFDSTQMDSRSCVLECSVYIEKMISETLGRLLEIDWKHSQSLGYKSGSLSFNSKLNLIQDLKGVSNNHKRKFQTFMTVRNKFAHIAEVNSFENYFEKIKGADKVKNDLDKWFQNLKSNLKNTELEYRSKYFLLALDLSEILFEINIEYAYEIGKKKGVQEAKDVFFEFVNEKLQETEDGRALLKEARKKILDKNKG